jgi:hypothetical protein
MRRVLLGVLAIPMLKTPRGDITHSFDSIIVLATLSRWRH